MTTSPIQTQSSDAAIYKRRRPERTVLHKTVRDNLETYLAATGRDDDFTGGVPFYVVGAFRSYLKCGILAHGFARVHCADCGHDFLVAFSCKGRDICPSCATRRMVETAAHMVDSVLPGVQFRQWVLSVPRRIRWHMRHKPEVTSGLLGIFLRAVETTVRKRSPEALAGARFGAVAFVHRFGSYLNSHVHYHVLVTDGVFSRGADGEAVLFPALDLDSDDFVAVQTKMRRRGLRWMNRHGHLDPAAVHTMDTVDHAGGWSVDASVTIPGWDRRGLERLVRYCARPPLSQERLSRLNDETLVYALRKPTPGGHMELILTPLELLDRLSKLVSPPRIHKHRYCGVLVPNAGLRRAVTETAGPAGATLQLLEEARHKMGLRAGPNDVGGPSDDDEPGDRMRRAATRCWVMLLARICECLPLLCPKCGKPMRIIAFILDRPVIERILDHIGESTTSPPVSPARPPPQATFDFDQGAGLPEWPDMDQTAGSADDNWD